MQIQLECEFVAIVSQPSFSELGYFLSHLVKIDKDKDLSTSS